MVGSEGGARAALLLLELGKAGSVGAPLQGIADTLSETKPTLLRTIKALIDHGFVEQVARGRYRLGPSIFSLARAENAAVLDIANWTPVLDKLTNTFGQTFSLVRHAGLDMVVLDKRFGAAPVQALMSEIGGRLPMGIGSGSVAILTSLDQADRDAIIAANANRYSKWRLTAEDVSELVREATVKGYVGDLGYMIPECGGIGVPIHERGRYTATMAIALSAPLQFFSKNKISDVAKAMKKAIADNLKRYRETGRLPA